jgi:hypothetical protein
MKTLEAGMRLGPYEILAPIGEGGMGQVYKASDTRLDRAIAIKVLPPHWGDNAEMKARFEREAQTIAALNHPNICVLHDIGKQDGIDFLVMEYLEGETLAARLERGALPLEEAIKTGIAIADALDKAHRRGVVHRDLKPGNIILTASGPKLLDFGLAKWKGSRNPDSSASQMPTRSDVTLPGTILGTLQYMAPEQLEGIEADARTDIFAFGVVFREMVTGKKTFEGKSRVLLMSAIATAEPEPLSQVQPEAPASLDHFLHVCLAKEPSDRWQNSRDLLAELQWAAGAGALVESAAPSRVAFGRREKILAALLGVAVLSAATLAIPSIAYIRGAKEPDEFRFRMPMSVNAEPVPLPANPTTAGRLLNMFNPANFAISPDGRTIAMVARANLQDTWFLYVRPIGSVAPQKFPGTEDAAQPFWSADGRSIGFFVNGKLKKVDASGGPPQDICDAPDSSGGTWNTDGTILFGSSKGLFRVSAEGGKPAAITTLDGGKPDISGRNSCRTVTIIYIRRGIPSLRAVPFLPVCSIQRKRHESFLPNRMRPMPNPASSFSTARTLCTPNHSMLKSLPSPANRFASPMRFLRITAEVIFRCRRAGRWRISTARTPHLPAARMRIRASGS